jgi:hypothetical protein
MSVLRISGLGEVHRRQARLSEGKRLPEKGSRTRRAILHRPRADVYGQFIR